MKADRIDLTQGSILKKLLYIVMPIIGTQLVQMSYNLTDTFWLGRIGPNAVAASGTAGMFIWLSAAFIIIGRMGAEIGVAQSVGAGNIEQAFSFSNNGVKIGFLLGIVYATILITFHVPLVRFFDIQEPSVVRDTEVYLSIVSIAMPANFITAALTGTFNSYGNTRTPFLINMTGLVINMILDPICIFIFQWGITGAAGATVVSQIIVVTMMIFAIKKSRHRPFIKYIIKTKINKKAVKSIFKWTIPLMLESMLFTLLSMVVMRYVNAFGPNAVAVNRVGSQVESFSWLIGGGFASALTAFIGQNYGARQWARIRRGFKISTYTMLLYGLAITFLLRLFAGNFYDLFLPEQPQIRLMGMSYLMIISLCQVPQCLEAVAGGTLKGIGKTMPPSIISIVSNILRVVLVIIISGGDWGLEGIWYVITITAIIRGMTMYLYYIFTIHFRSGILCK